MTTPILQIRTSSGIQPAELVSENKLSIWVRLPDGTVIKRNRKKHVVSDVLEEEEA